MSHEPSGFVRKGVWTVLVVSLPALGLEALSTVLILGWLARGWPFALVVGLCLHAAAAWAIWQDAPEAHKALEDEKVRAKRYTHALAALIVLFFPVIGLLGVACILSAKQVSHRKGLVEVVSAEMKRVANIIGVERVDDLDSFLIEESSVEPILEILKGNDVGLKRGAVSLLGSIGGREAVTLLRQSLSDASPEVRFYAHATLAKLDDSHTREIKAAEKAASPVDAASWERLGEAFTGYAASGLPEDVERGRLMDRAAMAFGRSLELAPEDSRLLLKLGRLHLGCGRPTEARCCFQAVPHDAPLRGEALLGLCEVAYELRDLDALTGLRVELSECSFDSDDPLRIVLYRFWAQGGEFA